MRAVVLAIMLWTLLVAGLRAEGQVPPGMKTYFNVQHGFQVHILETWKVKLEEPGKRFLVSFWDPDGRAVALVGGILDVAAELGEAFAVDFIAEEAQWFTDYRGWEKAEFAWIGRAPFTYPLGYYGIFEVTSKGDQFVFMQYYLRDDGTGRGLPSGRVTRSTMTFLTFKPFFKTFEETFHHMAGSLRFLTPIP